MEKYNEPILCFDILLGVAELDYRIYYILTTSVPLIGSYFIRERKQNQLKDRFRRHGKYKIWWSNGNKRSKSNWKNDKIDGKRESWNPYGSKIDESYWKDGKFYEMYW